MTQMVREWMLDMRGFYFEDVTLVEKKRDYLIPVVPIEGYPKVTAMSGFT